MNQLNKFSLVQDPHKFQIFFKEKFHFRVVSSEILIILLKYNKPFL